MQTSNVHSFTAYVLPPVLLGGAIVAGFVAGEFYTDRRKRRELYRLWQSERTEPRTGGTPAGAFPSRARAYFSFRHLRGYGVGACFVGLTLGIRLLLEPMLQGRLPYTFFLIPVLLTAMTAGLWETLSALVLGFLAAEWFIIEPRGTLLIIGANAWLGGLLYFLIGLGIVLFMGFAHVAGQQTLKSDLAYFKLLKEFDEQRASHAQLETVRELLGSIVESLPEAILSLTPEGQVMTWNRAAESLLGLPSQEVLGRPVANLFPPESRAEEQRLLEQVRRGERAETRLTLFQHKSRGDIEVLLDLSPVKDPAGNVVGAVVVARPVRQNAERRL